MAGGSSRAKPEAANPEDEQDTSGKFIEFTGHNGVRIISEEDWKAIKITGQGESQWDRTNGWRLPRSEFNEKALNYLLVVDGEFRATD